MTASSQIKVDPQVFYDAATALHNAAAALFTEVDNRWGALGDCAHMAGTYEEAQKWAASYDQHAQQVLQTVTNAAMAMDSYAGVLRTMGSNHAMADYNATMGDNKGAPPAAPTAPPPAVYTCRIPIPSAGGPANGLEDAGLKLCAKIGLIVPNGDTGKLASIAAVWSALASAEAVAQLPVALDRIIDSFGAIQSPEAEFVTSDLRAMRQSATAIGGTFAGLAAGCAAHKSALDELRGKIAKQLEDLVVELEKLIAETIAISVATSWITIGLGAAAATAAAVATAAKWAAPIRAVIVAWKSEKRIEQGIAIEQDLVAESRSLQQIEHLGQDLQKMEADAGAATAPAAVNLNAVDRAALWEYTGPDAERLNWVLRNDCAGARDKLITDDINSALTKLPDYQGPVTRRLTLSEEDLAQFKPGESQTFKGFTSSAKTPDAAFDKPVEMQILSKHGKDVSQFARKPEEQEVLFGTNTTFDIVDKFVDQSTGRTVIQMIER